MILPQRRAPRRLELVAISSCLIASSVVAQGGGLGTSGADIQLDAAPQIIGPGVISTSAEEFKATVSPDGRTPVALPFAGGDPAISADERFLIFDRDHTPGDADLFVSCRVGGGWSAPARLADPVNSTAEEGDPSISADGRTLYFFSTRFAPAAIRAPRGKRATYADIQREVAETFYNGSRNLYQVDISSMRCPQAEDTRTAR